MRMSQTVTQPYIVLSPEDYVVLGPQDFGSPGLEAIEIIGPYVAVKAMGPLITVHDSRVEPHLGIGHHPHRHNERIFYIMEGTLDHDDRLNQIKGHMATGDVGLFTEGRRGMIHSEWNNGDVVCHAFILVYTTDPIPEQTAFAVLADADAPRYEEAAGVRTKEMVGPRSPLRINGDVRLFTDTRLADGSRLELRLAEDEGGLVSVQSGTIGLNGESFEYGMTVLFPPMREPRHFELRAVGDARVLRVVHGPGFGLVIQ